MDTGRHVHAPAASRRHSVDARLQVPKDFGRATRLNVCTAYNRHTYDYLKNEYCSFHKPV
jgi:hypothetical protein